MYLSFKVELPKTALKTFLSGLYSLFRRGKTVAKPSGLLQVFRSEVSTIYAILARKKKLFFIFI